MRFGPGQGGIGSITPYTLQGPAHQLLCCVLTNQNRGGKLKKKKKKEARTRLMGLTVGGQNEFYELERVIERC